MKALIVAAILAFAAGFYVEGWRKDAEIASIKTEYAESLAKATSEAATTTARFQKEKDNALKQAQQAAAQNAVALATVSSTIARMRDEQAAASSRLSDSTDSSVRDYAATLNTVFGECRTALGEMAKNATGHALDSKTLTSSWPKQKENE